jgi:hypothetical protein
MTSRRRYARSIVSIGVCGYEVKRMNFQLWPSEQSEWSFPFALALMAILGGAVLFTFKRIGWL